MHSEKLVTNASRDAHGMSSVEKIMSTLEQRDEYVASKRLVTPISCGEPVMSTQ